MSRYLQGCDPSHIYDERVILVKKAFLVLCVLSVLLVSAIAVGAPKMKVMLYSSMKDSQLDALQKAFTKKYPDIAFDYYTAGTGKVLTKLAAEQQAGGIAADLIWVGEPTNYVEFKQQGLLEKYVSPEAKTIDDIYKDKDGYYCGARIVGLGIAYNTNTVKGNDIPKDWTDLLNPKFKGFLGMTDPAFSGTTLYTVAAFVQSPKYGYDFLKALKANGVKLVQGSSDSVTKVGSGEWDLSIAVDYIAKDQMDQGSPVGFVYPSGGASIVASPIAIVKGTKNLEAAKILYDYILSLEGQKVLVEANTIPIRKEIELPGLDLEKLLSNALTVDDYRLVAEKDSMLDKFHEIMR